MSSDTRSRVQDALSTLLGELFDGSSDRGGWVLNGADPGLLRSLESLSAEAASAVSERGAASIAAHLDHLRYHMSLLNQWKAGSNPFADADWTTSWKRPEVTAEEWSELRKALEAEARRWMDSVKEALPDTQMELTGVLASVVHLAYHMGSMRQIDRSIGGPKAGD